MSFKARQGQVCNNDPALGGKCVDIGMSTSYVGPTPAGWSSPTTPPATATATGTHVSCRSGSGSIQSAANDVACAAAIDAAFAAIPQTLKVCSYTLATAPATGTVCTSGFGFDCTSPVCASGKMQTVTDCPAGYGATATTCDLTNAALVQKPTDGRVTVKRVGNAFVVDPQDSADFVGMPPTMTIASTQVSFSDGTETRSVTIDPTTGKITATASRWNGDGTSTNTLVTFGTPLSAGADIPIAGQITGTYSGTGELAQLKGTSSATCGNAGQPACVSTISETGTPTGTGVNATGLAALLAITPSSLGISPMTSTPHASPGDLPSISGADSCTNPASVHIFGVDVVMDICGIWAPIKPWFAWALYALTALYIWRRLVGAPSAA